MDKYMRFRAAFPRVLLILGLAASLAAADDWPQFQGPTRTGSSIESGLARIWGDRGPKILWTIDVGAGFAGAAVRDGQVYVLDRIGERQDVLRCVDLATGRELWTCAYDAPGILPYAGSRQVATVDEKLVFAVGPFGHLNCFDRNTHKIVWSHHLVDDFKDPAIDDGQKPATRADKLARAQLPEWGMTQSPVLYNDVVIVGPQTQKVGLAAYAKSTGQLRWTSAYIGRNWYSHVSAYLTALCGVDQVIMLAQPSDPEKSPANAPPAIISSTDPKTGRILWQAQTPRPYKIPIPQPLRIADDRLLITGGYGVGCLIVKARKEGDNWSIDISGTNTIASHIQSPVLYNDHVYVQSHKEHGGANIGLVCLDLNGQFCWQTGAKLQFDFGSFLLADGLAFVMNGKNGELNLVDADPRGFKLLAKAKVLDAEGGNVWAPMALSDGKLIIRDQHKMKCVEVRKP